MASVYRQKLSPYWWLRLPRPGLPALRESTKIPWDAPTAEQRAKQKALAVTAFNARMGDLARNRYELPPAKPVAPPTPEAPPTLRAFLAWYDAHVVSTHRGATREREIVRRWARDLGDLPLPQITRERVMEWITQRGHERTGPIVRTKGRRQPARTVRASTINREVRVLKAALQRAADLGKIPASPLKGMAALKELTPKRRYLTPEDETNVLAAMRRPDDQALLIMGLDTLCRLGDCLDLKRSDDHGDRLWIAQTKTGEGRWVPVTPRLRQALDAIPKRGTKVYFFAHRRLDTPEHSAYSVRQMLERACERAGVRYGRESGGITWHWATRRTMANRLARAGTPLTTIQAAGGWKSSRMVLDVYAEGEYADVAQAMAALPSVPVPQHSRGIRRKRKAKKPE